MANSTKVAIIFLSLLILFLLTIRLFYKPSQPKTNIQPIVLTSPSPIASESAVINRGSTDLNTQPTSTASSKPIKKVISTKQSLSTQSAQPSVSH